jgi:hypothetical protein
MKNPVTPPGIDPATVRLVAQRLNHYATPGPEERIKNLETTVVNLQKQKSVVYVSHIMALTMIDAKICNYITSASSAQVCYVCGAASRQMNRIVKSLR